MCNLDPNRETPYMVVDYTDEVGREGIYAGSWEDCQEFLAEQGNICACIGIDIVPNPYYKREKCVAFTNYPFTEYNFRVIKTSIKPYL